MQRPVMHIAFLNIWRKPVQQSQVAATLDMDAGILWSFKYKLPDGIHAANHLQHTEEIALVHFPRSAQCPAVGSLWQHVGKYGENAIRLKHLLAFRQVD